MLELIVRNRLDFRSDVGAGFADFGQQVGQLGATGKVYVVRTVFSVFEGRVVTESFRNLLEPIVAFQAVEQPLRRFPEMAFELQDLGITIPQSCKCAPVIFFGLEEMGEVPGICFGDFGSDWNLASGRHNEREVRWLSITTGVATPETADERTSSRSEERQLEKPENSTLNAFRTRSVDALRRKPF
jgi:hypothetical protein